MDSRGFIVTGRVDQAHKGCTFGDKLQGHPTAAQPNITVIGGHESVGFDGGRITLTHERARSAAGYVAGRVLCWLTESAPGELGGVVAGGDI
jgi:small ligand-binding sensory domain FIST